MRPGRTARSERRLCDPGRWQLDRKGRSLPFAFTLRGDRTSQRFRKPPDDREAEARAPGRAIARSIGATKAIEHVRQMLGRNTASGVGHSDADVCRYELTFGETRSPLRALLQT
jgi:hypothetical protein